MGASGTGQKERRNKSGVRENKRKQGLKREYENERENLMRESKKGKMKEKRGSKNKENNTKGRGAPGVRGQDAFCYTG